MFIPPQSRYGWRAQANFLEEEKTAVENKKDRHLLGTVTARKCPTCGHHEVGFTTNSGAFYPLRPGSLIQVLEDHPQEGPAYLASSSTLEKSPRGIETIPAYKPWIPDPVKGYRSLRLKYGVRIAEECFSHGQIDGSAYQKAYLEKLWRLIEKEFHVPIAVILDQCFSTPHLASGNPVEIASAMFRELDEIRAPVVAVKTWLENPCEESKGKLILSKTEAELDDRPLDDRAVEKELNELTLEEFLSLL
jgi:hypothetical protein